MGNIDTNGATRERAKKILSRLLEELSNLETEDEETQRALWSRHIRQLLELESSNASAVWGRISFKSQNTLVREWRAGFTYEQVMADAKELRGTILNHS